MKKHKGKCRKKSAKKSSSKISLASLEIVEEHPTIATEMCASNRLHNTEEAKMNDSQDQMLVIIKGPVDMEDPK